MRRYAQAVCFAFLTQFASSALAETADDANKVTLSALATLTTDYVYRGISESAEHPAAHAKSEADYRSFYLGLWGSSVDFGMDHNPAGNLQNVADLELGWYGGVRPQWRGINFDFGISYYFYPGALQTAELNYVEFGAAATYTFFEKL